MTAARPICPCCGYDLAVDAPMLINDFAMNGAGFPLFYKQQQVQLSHGEALICWTLMKAYPDHVSMDVMAERLGSDAEDTASSIRVLISRIRRKLRALGAPSVIQTVMHHHAYIWSPSGDGYEIPAQDEVIPAGASVPRAGPGRA